MAVEHFFDFLNGIAPVLCGGVTLAILIILLISAVDRHHRNNKR